MSPPRPGPTVFDLTAWGGGMASACLYGFAGAGRVWPASGRRLLRRAVSARCPAPGAGLAEQPARDARAVAQRSRRVGASRWRSTSGCGRHRSTGGVFAGPFAWRGSTAGLPLRGLPDGPWQAHCPTLGCRSGRRHRPTSRQLTRPLTISSGGLSWACNAAVLGARRGYAMCIAYGVSASPGSSVYPPVVSRLIPHPVRGQAYDGLLARRPRRERGAKDAPYPFQRDHQPV